MKNVAVTLFLKTLINNCVEMTRPNLKKENIESK